MDSKWPDIFAFEYYRRGFRVHKSNFKSETLWVLKRNHHVTDVILSSGKIAKCAFTTGSPLDNHTPMVGDVGTGNDVVPNRYVENAVFLLGKTIICISEVQQLKDVSLDANVEFLKKSFSTVGIKMRNFLERKPELNDLNDPLVKVINSWPQENLCESLSSEEVKKAWIDQHTKLLSCGYTNPKLAKETGRCLPLLSSAAQLLFQTKMLQSMIAFFRGACLLCDPYAYVFCKALTLCEEFSFDDATYATKICAYEVEPFGPKTKCLDAFLEMPNDSKMPRSEILQILDRLSSLDIGKENAGPKVLGVANIEAVKIADIAFYDTNEEEYTLECHEKILSAGWIETLSTQYGFMDDPMVMFYLL